MKIIDIFGRLKQGKPILYNNDDLRLNVFLSTKHKHFLNEKLRKAQVYSLYNY